MSANSQDQRPDQPAPKKRGRGRPFLPGQSGNPTGRPKEVAEIRELARKEGPDSIKRLVYLRDNAEREATQLAAAEALLDRGYGRPVQAIAGEDGQGALQVIIQTIAAGG